MELHYSRFSCAFCGTPNDIEIDPSEGDSHALVHDCAVCCNPNLLTIRRVDGGWEVSAEPES